MKSSREKAGNERKKKDGGIRLSNIRKDIRLMDAGKVQAPMVTESVVAP